MNGALKKLRTDKRMTQAEIANRAGITEVTYQLYEYGKRTPNIRTAIRIADVLGVHDLRTLWDGNPIQQV